jgi:hypothetical protein
MSDRGTSGGEILREFVERKKKRNLAAAQTITQTTLILPHGVRMTLTALAKTSCAGFGGQSPVDDKTNLGCAGQ